MKKIILIVFVALAYINSAMSQKDFSPKYSNNGDKIAFYSYRNGTEPEIFLMDSNGKNIKQITPVDGNWAIEPRWSLNDDFLGYSMGENMGKLKLAVHDLKNNKISFVNDNNELQFITSWTKYGIEYGTKGKNGFDFYLLKDSDKTIESLSHNEFEDYFLITSSDGKSTILSVEDEDKNGLWLKEKKKDYKKLTDMSGKNISFSKDKKYIVFESVVQDNIDIYMIELATKKAQRITQNESHDYMPSLDPTGKFIVFSSNRSGQYFLYRKNLNSGKITQLTGI